MKRDLVEGIGLLMILLSFGCQYFSDELKEDKLIAPLIKMNDNILALSSDHIVLIEYLAHPDSTNKVSAADNIKDRHFDMYYWQNIKESFNSSKEQEKKITYIYMVLYVIGSLMVLFPKLFPNCRLFKKK